MNTTEIIREIYKIETMEDTMKIYEAFKLRHGQLKEIKAQDFSIGDKISWSKGGIEYIGKVTKINRNTLSAMAITPTTGRWTIGIGNAKKVE